MAEKVVVWDDWSGGEFGDMPLRQVAPNQFTAINMIVYRNGEIGPRPGLKDHSSLLSAGRVTGTGFTGTSGAYWWILVKGAAIGSAFAWNNTAGTPNWYATTATAVANSSASTGSNVEPSLTVIASESDKLYTLDTSGGAGTAVIGVVASHASATTTVEPTITLYRDRLYTADGTKVFYSDASDYTTWSSTNYFEVGYGRDIAALLVKGDSLLIFTADSAVWEYRGSPGSDSLRRVYNGTRHPWVFSSERSVVLPNDDLVFVPVQRDYPAIYSGGRVQELKHLKLLGGGEPGSGTPDPDEWCAVNTLHTDGVLLNTLLADPVTGNARAMERRDGIWHFYDWEAAGGLYGPGGLVASDQQGQILLTHNQLTSGTSSFWSFDCSLDRLGYTDDSYADVGDSTLGLTANDVHMTTGAWWAPEGQEITIKNIIVDFTKHNTGGSETTHFEVDVIQYAQHIQDETSTVAMQSFDEDQDQIGTDTIGDTEQDRFITGGPSGGAVPCSGFQIKLSDIRHVQIQAIRVIIDQNPATPRY